MANLLSEKIPDRLREDVERAIIGWLGSGRLGPNRPAWRCALCGEQGVRAYDPDWHEDGCHISRLAAFLLPRKDRMTPSRPKGAAR